VRPLLCKNSYCQILSYLLNKLRQMLWCANFVWIPAFAGMTPVCVQRTGRDNKTQLSFPRRRESRSQCPELLRCYILSVLTATFIIIAGFMVSSAFAEGEDLKENKKIHITSDRLIADNQAMLAEFIGNVVATRGTDIVTADRLKIFYKKGVDKKGKSVAGEEMIKKIVANGNVVIKFDDKVAVAQQAVYTAETGIIVLTGPNSKVTSGNNFISGEKITMYRSDDRMIVEGGKEKRVEAVFYSKDNNIQELRD